MRLGNREADRVTKAVAKRAGSHLDALRVVVLGKTRRVCVAGNGRGVYCCHETRTCAVTARQSPTSSAAAASQSSRVTHARHRHHRYLGVAGGDRPDLAEVLKIIQRHLGVDILRF